VVVNMAFNISIKQLLFFVNEDFLSFKAAFLDF